MEQELLLLFMSALGIGLGLNPITNKINSGLFKGSTWLVRGIIIRLIK